MRHPRANGPKLSKSCRRCFLSPLDRPTVENEEEEEKAINALPSENQAVPSRRRALLLLLRLLILRLPLLLQPLSSSACTKQDMATKAGQLQSATPAASQEG